MIQTQFLSNVKFVCYLAWTGSVLERVLGFCQPFPQSIVGPNDMTIIISLLSITPGFCQALGRKGNSSRLLWGNLELLPFSFPKKTGPVSTLCCLQLTYKCGGQPHQYNTTGSHPKHTTCQEQHSTEAEPGLQNYGMPTDEMDSWLQTTVSSQSDTNQHRNLVDYPMCLHLGPELVQKLHYRHWSGAGNH